MLSCTTSLLFQYMHCAVLQIWLHIFLWDYLICLNPDTPDCKLKEQWDIICFFSHQMLQFSSVQFSHSVVSNSLWSHEPQHARPPYPLPTLGVNPNPCPSSRWCHPTISSSVRPFSSCPQSLPASGSFPVSQLFAWGGQSIGSFSFNISPSNEHPGLISFRIDWLDLFAVQGTLKAFSNTTVQKHQFFGTQPSSQSNSHIHTWPQEKP